MLPKRKTIRLNESLYRYPGPPCSLTITVQGREQVFGLNRADFTRAAIQTVKTHAEKNAVPIHMALFMPDHVHICAEASPQKSLIVFIAECKNLIARASWQFGHQETFWQRSFFDHFLRTDENITTVVAYILHNPIRAKLVSRWEDYPFWFSNKYTIEQLKSL